MRWRFVGTKYITALLLLLPVLLLLNILSTGDRMLAHSLISSAKDVALSGKQFEESIEKADQKHTRWSSSVPADPSVSSVVRMGDEREYHKQPVLVLLLSSTPRSGSSFVGELLATHNTSVYFFEPMHKLQHTPCIKSDECVSQYLRDKFQCRLDDEFENWLKAKTLFFGFYNEETKKCIAKPQEWKKQCLKRFNMTQACEDSQDRIVKVIRARLSQVESLLADDSLNLKIIHLYRDPRGFMKSIMKFKDWNKDPSFYCSGLSNDLQASISLQEKYPNKILQVPYERISLNPTEYTKLMFNFAFGSPDLPQATENYLATHTEKQDEKSKSTMSRTKDSSKIYQAWRDTISAKLLQTLETNVYCEKSINLMKNRLFGNINSVRNKNISMFL